MNRAPEQFFATALALFLLSGAAHARQTSTPEVGAPSASSDTVTLRAVGDLVLGNNWPSGGWPPGYEKTAPLQLKRVLGDADTIFGNFEGALTTHNVSTKTPRGTSVFAFRMPPHFATLLRDAGFGVIAIANNHTLDFSETGYRDTVKNLADAGILVVGKPDQIALQKIRNVTIAWIAFSHLVPSSPTIPGRPPPWAARSAWQAPWPSPSCWPPSSRAFHHCSRLSASG